MDGISIVIPTFNRGGLLSGCVESILQQDFAPLEVIIVNDGSTDSTAEVARYLVSKDPRIRSVRNPTNLGLPMSRNIGTADAKFNRILFMDDDSRLAPHCLSTLDSSFDSLEGSGSRVGVVSPRLVTRVLNDVAARRRLISRYRRFWQRRAQTRPNWLDPETGIVYRGEYDQQDTLQSLPDVHACSLYSKPALLHVGGFDSRAFRGTYLYEETDLNLRLRAAGYGLFGDPKAVVFHFPEARGGARKGLVGSAIFFLFNHTRYLLRHYPRRFPRMLVRTIYVTLRATVTADSERTPGTE